MLHPAAVDGPTLQIVLGRSRAREKLADGCQLFGAGSVRSGGDCDVLVGEVLVAADEQERLDRLRRRAHERDEPSVSVLRGHLPIGADPHRVDAVAGLDHASPGDGYCERIHGGGA